MKKILQSLIPPEYFSWLMHLKNVFFGRPRKSYSQFGEDIVLAKLLKKKNGFYVDVGAYHPTHYSNTYLLYEKGWRGINIDPNPLSIKLFERYRNRDVNVAAGISEEKEYLTLYTFSHSNWNTFSKEKAEQWMRKPGVNFLGEQKVPCVPLREVLKEHVPTGTVIDLLNIDAEGMDLSVLQSSDWGTYLPRVIVVESAQFNPDSPREDKIYSFLTEKRYALHAFMGVSLIFRRNA